MFRIRFVGGVAVALIAFAPSAFAQRTFNGRIDASTLPGGFRPGVYGNVYQGNQIDFRSGNYSGAAAYGNGYYNGFQPNFVPYTIQADPLQNQRRIADAAAQRAFPPTSGYVPTGTAPSGPVAPDAGSAPGPGSAPAAGVSVPSPPARSTARITVRLPADAELWFESVKTRKAGTERAFTTPAVQTGGHYGYLVTARWIRDGNTITRERMVRFQAGSDVVVDFERPDDVTTPNTQPRLP